MALIVEGIPSEAILIPHDSSKALDAARSPGSITSAESSDIPDLPVYIEADEVPQPDPKVISARAFQAEYERVLSERDGLQSMIHLLRLRNKKNEELVTEKAADIQLLKRENFNLREDLQKAQTGIQMAVQRQRDFELQLEDSIRAWEHLDVEHTRLQRKYEDSLEQYSLTRRELDDTETGLRAAIVVLSIFLPLLLVFRQFAVAWSAIY